ncbi:ThuA domain-containing protein [Roseimaritima ulvae]|uniref:Trehalose utilization n=1 Tax=Roseimaritima ulvae TaxID=980254 RepID=A0A5B9QKC1_9BACT|nr:ThuA domain-containing protein [Roseimaritima ulvae]QEG39557.1 Trehalose utilization [Roseimaritima ulvae]
MKIIASLAPALLLVGWLFSSPTPLAAADAEPYTPLVYEGGEGIGKGKHIVLIANDHEYRSEQTCPLLAKVLAKRYGFRCTVLFGLDDDGAIKPGAKNTPGMKALRDADLLFFFTRFMNLPDQQADALVDYFERGGPVVGVRTSTHCFNGQQGKWAKLNYNYSGDDYRGGLGEQVFGNTWHKQRGQSHYGQNHVMGSRITPVSSATDHPILRGIDSIHAYSGAYKSQPPADATPLLEVQVLNTLAPSDDIRSESPVVNAGWTRDSYVAPSGDKKQARVVYTSFGASEDLQDEAARRFLVNACLWAAGMEDQITPDLDVRIVGDYAPTPYTNGAFFYEGVKPSQLSGWDSRIMPADAPVAGMDDPKSAAKRKRILANRPEMRARLESPAP